MSNLAEQRGPALPPKEDPVIRARADALRAVIATIPNDQLMAVLWESRDSLPLSLLEKLQPPKRGGDVLNNVYELFQRQPAATMSTSDVFDQLAQAGKPAEHQPIRGALNYLKQRRFLQRIGYGLYRLDDGSLIEGPP